MKERVIPAEDCDYPVNKELLYFIYQSRKLGFDCIILGEFNPSKVDARIKQLGLIWRTQK